MQHLKGRIAVVTAGANGIGYGLAARFLKESTKVVIADNAAAALRESAENNSVHAATS